MPLHQLAVLCQLGDPLSIWQGGTLVSFVFDLSWPSVP